MLMIRKAALPDAECIARIHAEAWRAAYYSFVPTDFLDNRAKFEARYKLWNELLSQEHNNHYAVESDGKIVGFFSIAEARDTDIPKCTCELVAIYFAPDCWHKGYGTQAMRSIIEHAKERGFTKLSLWAFEENIRAIRFYVRFGFQFDGKKNELNLGKPITECRYQLQLSKKRKTI